MLKEISYDGYLGIECRVAEPVEDALREASAFLRQQWDDAQACKYRTPSLKLSSVQPALYPLLYQDHLTEDSSAELT